MANETIVGRYEGGAVSGETLEGAINEALREISDDPQALAELERYGVDRQSLAGVEISVTQQPGVVVETVILAVALAAAGELTADGIKAVWRLVARKVREHQGADALGKERPEDS